MKPTKLILIFAILLLVLSACGGTPETANPVEPAPQLPADNNAAPPPVADPDAGDALEYPLTVTDVTGHTVTLEKMPERIVIAGKATLMVQDAIFMFEEARTRIVAIENRGQSALTFLPYVDPTLEDKVLLEKNAGPEQIAPLTPDLVLLKSFNTELGATIEALGIPVLYFDLETPEVFMRDIDTLSQVFANPARAEEIKSFYQTRLDLVEGLVSSLTTEEKPAILVLQYNMDAEEIAWEVPPDTWLQTMMVELVGGDPIWKGTGEGGGWTIVSLDQIAAWDPEQIYIIDYDGAGNEIIAGLKADPLWQELAATQTDQLFAFPVDHYSWDQPDTRWILGLEWLAVTAQPELAGEINILDEVNAFYSVLYGMDEAAIQTNVLPLLADDTIQ